ncbi:MAG: hypothetical protein WCE52_10915, partial [Candidatus Acidiferrum sp.]
MTWLVDIEEGSLALLGMTDCYCGAVGEERNAEEGGGKTKVKTPDASTASGAPVSLEKPLGPARCRR